VAVPYLDASAFVKLFADEPESSSLRGRMVGLATSSDLLAIEARRTARRLGGTALERADDWLERIELIPIDADVCELAGSIGPPRLASVDAIHLATAFLIRERLGALITYDRQLARAAEGLGLPVLSPR
jgi:predicted nucleic acid-binding protein